MKKIYFFFMLMVMSVSGAFAQEPIAKLSELSNAKAYTIASSRCGLQVIKDGTCLYTTTGTATGIVEFNEKDPNQHFALINGGKNFFLYSVGASKFVDKSGKLTDEVTSDVAINVVETGDENFAFNLNWGSSNYLNTQEPGNFATGYIIDSWSTLDNGNKFQIIEAADFNDAEAIKKAQAFDGNIVVSTVTYIYKCDGEEVTSYTKVTKGVAPFTVTYDAPASPIGVTCSDATPESKEINADTEETVVYTFTVDTSVLPFAPTTITENGFADGTKWYYLKPYNEDTYMYSSDSDNDLYYKAANGSTPVDLHYLYTFTGNPLKGFKIYNYSKGSSLSISGDSSSSYGSVSFVANNTCEFYLEEGNSDGQYRFPKVGYPDSYIHGYSGKMELYTWGEGWAASDKYSQFYIAEVADKTIEQALSGVIAAVDVTVPYGTIFREGAGLSSVQIMFEGTSSDNGIVIADGMASSKITFVDADGNVVATPTYAVNADDQTVLDITFDSEFNTPGTYTLVIPEGLVKGNGSLNPNTKINLKYTFMSEFEEKIVTARIWKKYDVSGYDELTPVPALPYATHEDGEYYTCKVKITGTDTFVLLDWLNTGAEKDTIKVQFNPSESYYNVICINDKTDLDDYGSSWLSTSTKLDAGYYGCYVTPGGSDAYCDKEYGMCCIDCYSYETNDDMYIFADWYMDNRYAYTDIIESTVHGSAFQELDYTDDYNPALPNLPYENGIYSINVGIANDSTIVLQGYRGVAGEDLTIVFDPSTGDVKNFNGLEIDEESGSSEIASGVWAYIGSYSPIKYDPETKSGYAVISLWDDALYNYYYIYVSIGDYTPTTDIKAVAGETDGKAVIYNLAGQKMTSPRKGVNIINGKKVMVK